MVKYKLFEFMTKIGIDKGQKNYLRKNGLNPKTVDSIIKGKSVTIDTINALCKLLNCQPGDIMEYVPDIEQPKTNNVHEKEQSVHEAEQSAPEKVQEEPVLEIVQSKQSKVHRESDIDFKAWIYDLYMEYSEKEHAELLKEIRLYGESKGNSAQDHKFRIILLKHAHIIEELPSKGCYRLIAE